MYRVTLKGSRPAVDAFPKNFATRDEAEQYAAYFLTPRHDATTFVVAQWFGAAIIQEVPA